MQAGDGIQPVQPVVGDAVRPQEGCVGAKKGGEDVGGSMLEQVETHRIRDGKFHCARSPKGNGCKLKYSAAIERFDPPPESPERQKYD